MTTHNFVIKLSTLEIELLERSIKNQIRQLSNPNNAATTKQALEYHDLILKLVSVLGMLRNHKLEMDELSVKSILLKKFSLQSSSFTPTKNKYR